MEILTGKQFLSALTTLGESRGKIFLPSEFDEKVSDGIVRMFLKNQDGDIIEPCIKKYIAKNRDLAISLHDFASRLTGIYEEILAAKKSRQEIEKLLQETKKRMEHE